MSESNDRRKFLKYLAATAGFVVASTSGIKINEKEGFVIGKNKYSLKASEAYGECGASYDCSGDGGGGGDGECGASYSCSGGGGECGASYSCSGGGGECGASYDCAGG